MYGSANPSVLGRLPAADFRILRTRHTGMVPNDRASRVRSRDPLVRYGPHAVLHVTVGFIAVALGANRWERALRNWHPGWCYLRKPYRVRAGDL